MENIQPIVAQAQAEAQGPSIFSFIFMMLIVFIIIFALAYVLAKDQLMSILPPTVATYLSTLDIYFSTLWSTFTNEHKEDEDKEKEKRKERREEEERKKHKAEEHREEQGDRFMRPTKDSALPSLPPPINERKPLSNISSKPPTHRQDYGTPSSDDFPPKTINDNLESPSYPADKSGGWCYVGASHKSSDKGPRTCIEVGQFDKCMSGDIFPCQSICVNPKLKR